MRIGSREVSISYLVVLVILYTLTVYCFSRAYNHPEREGTIALQSVGTLIAVVFIIGVLMRK